MTRTYEGTALKGEIHLDSNGRLPENARVCVVVPEASDAKLACIRTPRLAHSEQTRGFQMEMSNEIGSILHHEGQSRA